MTEPRTIYRTVAGHQRIRSWCESAIAGWGQPHESRTVTTALGSTHVLTAGEGPDLVLLAGTNFAAATWLHLVSALATSHTVHAIDLPGQPGLSAPQRPKASSHAYGRWLDELLPTLGITRPAVLGHSLGAVVALRAAAHGADVHRLVLIDPAGIIRLRVSPGVMRPTLPWLRTPDLHTSARLLQMMMSPGGTPDEELVHWMALVGEHVRTSLAPAPLRRHDLSALGDLPVTILSGEDDAFLPPRRLASIAHKRMRVVQVTIVRHAGHLLPHERPDAVTHHLATLTT